MYSQTVPALISKNVGNTLTNYATWNSVMINVNSYGATGNGVTDDTAAVQAAINAAIAAGMKAVFFPNGTYVVTSLSNLSSVVLFGDNASFSGISNIISQLGSSTSSSDYFNVTDYGAVGDGTTNDAAAINAATLAASTAGGGTVFFPIGTYIFNSVITGYANVHLLGAGKDISVLKAGASMSQMIKFLDSKDNFSIKNLTVDFNNMNMLAEGIAVRLSNYFIIEDCNFLNIPNNCLSMNGVNRFHILRNTFERTTMSNAVYNVCMTIGEASGTSSEGYIEGNLFNKSAINLSGADHKVLNNEVKDFGCGCGIVTEQATNSLRAHIIGNVIHGGRGTDVNATVCGGIECWSPFSTVENNTIYDNGGVGVDWGSRNGILSGNMIYNNGVTVNSPAISIRYADTTYNGNNSVISANRCFDNSGTKHQTYGIEDQSSSSNYVMITGNNLKGCLTGPMHILGTQYSINQNNLYFSIVWDPASLANGSSVEQDVVAAGVTLGDYVIASCSIDLQGVKLIPRVNALNNVKLRLENNTGGAIDLASATYRVLITKPIDAADY